MSTVAADTLSDFQRRIGYEFRDAGLLERALTHKSFTNEHREARSPNNERMEFLGDAVLGFVVGEHTTHSPDSRRRALSRSGPPLPAALSQEGAGPRELGGVIGWGLGRPLRGPKALAHRHAFEAISPRSTGGDAGSRGLRRRTSGPRSPDERRPFFHEYKTALKETEQGGNAASKYEWSEEFGRHEEAFGGALVGRRGLPREGIVKREASGRRQEALKSGAAPAR